ncbi:arylsulfatase [Labilibacter sediminis]|nr:arylsulfatase [Labilibacter sediminis]
MMLISSITIYGKGKKPNILLIMADDIGYSDIGCYGSEINTPNLDMLAEGGVRFKQFYNMAKCNPTRSAMLMGQYQGNENSVNIATRLKAQGYETMHCGKEHFDVWVPQSGYAQNCFDKSFAYWTLNEFLMPGDSTFMKPFVLNGKALKAHEIEYNNPEFYKPDVVTDYALKFLNEKQEKPFFLYMAYNIAHFPLQALPEDIAKYRNRYKVGWDKLRQQRYERQLEMGLIEKNTVLSPPEDNINRFRPPIFKKGKFKDVHRYREWESIRLSEQDSLDLEMSVFAAMIDRMDQNIGRLIQKLKVMGEYENTLIIFLTDNGSCPYFARSQNSTLPIGVADSKWSLSAPWANLGNTPFRYFKQYGHEGGCNTHFIAHWPDHIKPNSIESQTGHVLDLYPTFLELAGDKDVGGLDGQSLLPVLKGKKREEPEFYVSGHKQFRMFRRGDWKLIQVNKTSWELYNIKEDPTELSDLSETHPDVLEELKKVCQNWMEEHPLVGKSGMSKLKSKK